MIREYNDYLNDIISAIDKAQKFIGKMDYEAFQEDEKTAFAVVRTLEVIGEAVKSIPDTIKKKHKDIPWKEMAGMRDKLIHEYFGVKYDVVWETAMSELPALKDKFSKIIKERSS